MTDQPLTDDHRQTLLGLIDRELQSTGDDRHTQHLLAIRRQLEGTDKQLLVRDHGRVSPASATTTSPEARPQPRGIIDKELKVHADAYLFDQGNDRARALDWLLQQDALTVARFAMRLAMTTATRSGVTTTYSDLTKLTEDLEERGLRLREQATPTPRRVSTLRDGRYVEKF